jgi:RNase P protein component
MPYRLLRCLSAIPKSVVPPLQRKSVTLPEDGGHAFIRSVRPIDHSMKSNTQVSMILYQHEYENVKPRKCSITHKKKQIKRATVRYSRRRKIKSVTETLNTYFIKVVKYENLDAQTSRLFSSLAIKEFHCTNKNPSFET